MIVRVQLLERERKKRHSQKKDKKFSTFKNLMVSCKFHFNFVVCFSNYLRVWERKNNLHIFHDKFLWIFFSTFFFGSGVEKVWEHNVLVSACDATCFCWLAFVSKSVYWNVRGERECKRQISKCEMQNEKWSRFENSNLKRHMKSRPVEFDDECLTVFVHKIEKFILTNLQN